MVRRTHPVDVHVGSRVRLRRTLLGMSQGKLAEAVGLTFQQIQNYENGLNRMGASRLHQFSQILDVPISFFFDDLPEHIAGARHGTVALKTWDAERDHMARRETLELVRAYYRISEPAVRKRLFDLAKSIAASGEAGE